MSTLIRPASPRLPSPQQRLMKYVNAAVTRLLFSPFHGLLSGRVLAIDVTGRRSGATYRIPVEYAQELGEILIITDARRQWWRNLIGGSDVMLRLRGFDVHAVGAAETDPDRVLAGVRQLYRFTPARAAKFAAGKVLLRLHLSALPSSAGF